MQWKWNLDIIGENALHFFVFILISGSQPENEWLFVGTTLFGIWIGKFSPANVSFPKAFIHKLSIAL